MRDLMSRSRSRASLVLRFEESSRGIESATPEGVRWVVPCGEVCSPRQWYAMSSLEHLTARACGCHQLTRAGLSRSPAQIRGDLCALARGAQGGERRECLLRQLPGALRSRMVRVERAGQTES